ncbi:MAG: hypothetical protein KDI61_03175 [Alphaproteobacteria bacterium]|nr:hypothetical protein [Alphaproteobacteria bacterium]
MRFYLIIFVLIIVGVAAKPSSAEETGAEYPCENYMVLDEKKTQGMDIEFKFNPELENACRESIFEEYKANRKTQEQIKEWNKRQKEAANQYNEKEKPPVVDVLVFPPKNEEEERHFRDILGDEEYEKTLKEEQILKNLTEEEKAKIYEDHKKNVSSKYPEETPEIKEKRKTLIQSTYSRDVFSTVDPISGRDPCEDRDIKVGDKDDPFHFDFDPKLDQLCQEIMQIMFNEEGKRSSPSFISLNIVGGYKFTYNDTQIDFNTIYITKNNITYVGVYIGNHAGFPLEKLSPENTTKEIKKGKKTTIEEWAGKQLVRKQVRIETGNDFPAEFTAWTAGDLNKEQLKEAIEIIDSFNRELPDDKSHKDAAD